MKKEKKIVNKKDVYNERIKKERKKRKKERT